MDLVIFNFIHNFTDKLFLIDWLMIFFARWMPYFLVIWFILLLLKERNTTKRYYLFFFAALSTIISRGIITELIRFFYNRPRPFEALNFATLIAHDTGGSFPSGHMAFYAALIISFFMFSKKIGTWYMILVILMGIARIYTGVHYPLDILGGVVIALMTSYVVFKVIPQPKSYEQKLNDEDKS